MKRSELREQARSSCGRQEGRRSGGMRRAGTRGDIHNWRTSTVGAPSEMKRLAARGTASEEAVADLSLDKAMLRTPAGYEACSEAEMVDRAGTWR